MRDKLHAEWFWVDRWMGSSAFCLPMEARGVYREMLSQAWLRSAQLPLNFEAIQRVIGCTKKEWNRAWPLIGQYWRDNGAGSLVNDTQLEVYTEAKTQAERASARGVKGAQACAQAKLKRVLEHHPPSPSPSLKYTDLANPITGVRSQLPGKPTSCASPHNGAARCVEDFEAFWREYPRKVGKIAAMKAWQKQQPPLDAILASLKWQRVSEQWQRENGQFIPWPATYLHQGRWMDEPTDGPYPLMSELTRKNAVAVQQFIAKGKRS